MDVRFDSLLDEALEAWQHARRGVIEEAEVFDADEFGFRPSSASRTIAELLRHILESGLMAVGELTDPAGDFARRSFAEHVEAHAGHLPDDVGRDELIRLLSSTLEEGVARMRAAGEVAMLQHIRRFDGVAGTRLAWFHHHIAHEEYHRGQLALYNRLCGHVPALTRRIEEG